MIEQGHAWVLCAAATIIGASFLSYEGWPVVGIAIGLGSSAVALIVMAHLGVIAALVASLAILRRRSRR
jgi:hypothetical protein